MPLKTLENTSQFHHHVPVLATGKKRPTRTDHVCSTAPPAKKRCVSKLSQVTTPVEGMTDLPCEASENIDPAQRRRKRVRKNPGAHQRAPRTKRICGLVNDGNLCYLNSIMQVLLSNEAFVDEVLRLEDNGMHGVSVTGEIAKLIRKRQKLEEEDRVGNSRRDLPCVRQLKDALATHVPTFFSGEDQQDTDEAFTHIINALSNENRSYKCPFTHTILQRIVCTGCGHDTNTEEQHIRQTLPLRPAEGKPSLHNVLVENPETLVRDCAQCGGRAIEHVCSRSVVTLPKTLVIQLGRVDDWMRKIDDKIKPEETDQLKLVGVVHHRGSGSRGHYYAAVHSLGDQWSLADDTRVRCMKHAEVFKQSSTSCMLFYNS